MSGRSQARSTLRPGGGSGGASPEKLMTSANHSVSAHCSKGDWIVTVAAGTATTRRRGGLPGYEQRLLYGLGRDSGETRLSSLATGLGDVLDATRKTLIRDGVHHHWIKHLRHDQRTAKGEQLAGQVRSFRRDLRWLVAGGDQRAFTGPLLPFAPRFGLPPETQVPLVRFAHAWVRAFARLPGWAAPEPPRPECSGDPPLFADIGNILGADSPIDACEVIRVAVDIAGPHANDRRRGRARPPQRPRRGTPGRTRRADPGHLRAEPRGRDQSGDIAGMVKNDAIIAVLRSAKPRAPARRRDRRRAAPGRTGERARRELLSSP